MTTMAERQSDRGSSRLRVCHRSDDGAVVIEVTAYKGATNTSYIASIEFCTFCAGGESPKTHAAIIALALAMQEDAK